MALCPGDTTQWEDIHRRLGNFAPKPKEKPQRLLDKALQEAAEKVDPLEHCTLQELTKLEDDVEEDTLASYRRKRLEELRAAQKAARFGEALQVTRTNFVAEVTEGSMGGQWVAVLLYVDAHFACQQIFRPWVDAARRFPAVKFMRGVASEVVPDLPDDLTPMVLLYRDGEKQHEFVGMREWGGPRCDADCIAWVLAGKGVVQTDLEEDPRLRPADDTAAGAGWRREERRRGSASEDEEEEDAAERGVGGGADRCYSSVLLSRRAGRG